MLLTNSENLSNILVTFFMRKIAVNEILLSPANLNGTGRVGECQLEKRACFCSIGCDIILAISAITMRIGKKGG